MAAILSLSVFKRDSDWYADPVSLIELVDFRSLLIDVQTLDTQLVESFYIKLSQYIFV